MHDEIACLEEKEHAAVSRKVCFPWMKCFVWAHNECNRKYRAICFRFVGKPHFNG